MICSIRFSNRLTRTVATTLAVNFSLFAAACSNPQPHLGESVTKTSVPGAEVVRADSISILPSGGLAGQEAEAIQVQAKVISVDAAARTLVLATSTGKQTIAVPETVRNFAQIRPDDMVRIIYARQTSFEMREPTAEEIAASGDTVAAAGRAALGSLPAAGVAAATLSIVTVESVDKDKNLVTVKTNDGRSITVPAKYPENLHLIKKGQKAVVTYGESVIAGIERVN